MSRPHASALTGAAMPPALPATAAEAAWPVRASVSWSGIMISVADDLAGVEKEWRAFEAEADGTAFQTFDWLARWQKHIGAANGTVPAIVVGRDAGGATLFLFPLAVERAGIARHLTWLGTALCDYNGPLLAPAFATRIGDAFPALWREILALLRANARFRFDFIDLPKMLDTIGGQRNPFIDLEVHPNPSGAYVASLGDDWEAYYAAKRSGQTRKKERKQLKQLAEHGEVRFVSVAGRAEIGQSMATLIEQKSHSFTRLGVRNNFTRPGYREFYLDLTTDPRTAAMVHVSRLDVGATAVAASLGLRFHGSYYLVLSSYQDGELARFGPGRAHLHELIRYAIGEKIARFDFTIGDEPYKRDWSDIVLRPYDHLAAVTLRGQLAVAGMLAFRWLKRVIKQTPVLWQAFSKLRAFRGSLGARRADDTATDAE